MILEIQYSTTAVKQLKKVFKGDKKSAEKIVQLIESYSINQNSNLDIKILKGELGEFKRLRMGNYRIIFDQSETKINIYEIKHRQEAYLD